MFVEALKINSELLTFIFQIIESVGISKTTKIKLFNDHSLKPIIRLYCWKGPVKSKFKRKRKLGEEEVPVAYVSVCFYFLSI